MLAAGAAEADGQVALAFADVVRNQVHQQGGDTVNEFLCLGKRADVFRHLGVASRQMAELRNKVGIGQEAHVEEQVHVVGHAGAVSKADDGDQNVLVGATAGELLRDVGTQLV